MTQRTMMTMPGKWMCKNPLSLEQRMKIEIGLSMKLTYSELAVYVGRCKSVVLRESKRLGDHKDYDAHLAQQDFEHKQMKRKKNYEEEYHKEKVPKLKD